jgi:hypothetical protein
MIAPARVMKSRYGLCRSASSETLPAKKIMCEKFNRNLALLEDVHVVNL